MYRYFSYIFLFIVLSCFSIILFFPNQFQKFNSIRAAISYETFSPLDSINKFDVSTFLRNIPYSSSPEYVYSVLPEIKFRNTILNGSGDCSNMSFGAAYYFINNNIEFELIHFLPEKSLFSGGGHVATRLPYTYENKVIVGIVDFAGGGIITDGWGDLEAAVNSNNRVDYKFLKLNNSAPDYYKNYYTVKYLSDVHIGFTPKDEIKKYFQFIDNYYLPLNSEKLEKYIYDGLALLTNNYYKIYVDIDFISLFEHEILFFSLLLILIRILILLTPIMILIETFVYKNHKKIDTLRNSSSSFYYNK